METLLRGPSEERFLPRRLESIPLYYFESPSRIVFPLENFRLGEQKVFRTKTKVKWGDVDFGKVKVVYCLLTDSLIYKLILYTS